MVGLHVHFPTSLLLLAVFWIPWLTNFLLELYSSLSHYLVSSQVSSKILQSIQSLDFLFLLFFSNLFLLFAVPLTALIIIRDALLVGAGFYVRYISLAPPVQKEKFDLLNFFF